MLRPYAVTEQGLQERVNAGGRQGIKPQLRVRGLAAPAVLVLRTIVHQEQQPGGRQALDQAIEQRLRLRINPVQILEDQQHGLDLAFAHQHALQGVEGTLAALRGIEPQERTLLRQRIDKSQQRGIL